MKLIRDIHWYILQRQRDRLIPSAFFDEKKRIKLCRIDEKLIELKRKKVS